MRSKSKIGRLMGSAPGNDNALVKPPSAALVYAALIAAVVGVVVVIAVYSKTQALEAASSRLFEMRLPALEAVSALRAPIQAQEAILYQYAVGRNRERFQTDFSGNHEQIVLRLNELSRALNSDDSASVCKIGLSRVRELAERLDQAISDPGSTQDSTKGLIEEVGLQANAMAGELDEVVESIRHDFRASLAETHSATRMILLSVYAYTAVLAVVGVLVGISLRRYFQASAQQRTIALFPERNPTAVLRLSRSGVITYANPGASALLGSLRADDRALEAILPPALDERFQELVSGGGRMQNWEYSLEDRVIRCSAHYVGDDDVVHAYLTDVTEQHRTDSALKDALNQVRELSLRLEDENVYLKAEVAAVSPLSDIVGDSPGLQSVLQGVAQVAPTSATVLILGESGVGKESLAKAIHERSERSAGPFVKLNCAAIPANLVESELFGHEKGAFTGANARRKGRFELASGGTLFLDEVGELPLDTQAKLLRILQEHEFERVGGSCTVRADVRIIAATNRELSVMVAEGSFRADLYYRINVFPVWVPPLRDRRADIPDLVGHFVRKFAAAYGKSITGLSSRAIERITRYDWPGNIRELQNVIERAVIVSTTEVLEIAPLGDSPNVPARGGLLSKLVDVERQHISQTLTDCEWIIEGSNGAAEQLGLAPATLRSKMKKLGISRPVVAMG